MARAAQSSLSLKYSVTSPPHLPCLSLLIALHSGTPVILLIPPSLTNTDDNIALGKDESIHFFHISSSYFVCWYMSISDVLPGVAQMLPLALPPSDAAALSSGISSGFLMVSSPSLILV